MNIQDLFARCPLLVQYIGHVLDNLVQNNEQALHQGTSPAPD